MIDLRCCIMIPKSARFRSPSLLQCKILGQCLNMSTLLKAVLQVIVHQQSDVQCGIFFFLHDAQPAHSSHFDSVPTVQLRPDIQVER